MLSRKTIETYLFFLLRHKVPVALVVALMTGFLAWTTHTRLVVQPDFQSLYPPNHPYIQLYKQYRNMFGTAITVQIVVEVKNGTIFDDPATVQKVDRITVELLHDVPGVNGEQVLSITHPKLKTTLTSGSGIKIVPLTYPRVPETRRTSSSCGRRSTPPRACTASSSRRTTRRRRSSPASGRSTSTSHDVGEAEGDRSSASRTPTPTSTSPACRCSSPTSSRSCRRW